MFLRGSSDIISNIAAYKNCQYKDYWLMPLHSASSTKNVRPIIVNTTLTLIIRIAQLVCQFPFNP